MEANPNNQASDGGASLVEYALLVGLIAVICIAAITVIGQTTSDKYSAIASGLGSKG